MWCRLLIGGFGLAYLIALFLLAVGTFGWFGADRDPLSGVFLAPLGLPWNLLTGSLPDGAPRILGAMLAPLLNLGILAVICRAVWQR